MKILSLHCDYIKFKPLQKAIKSTADLQEKDKKEVSVKDPLGIFVAVEKTDEGNLKKAIDNLVSNILDLKDKVKAAKIVLYPYAHLSSSLSSPDFAREVLEGTEALLKKQKIETLGNLLEILSYKYGHIFWKVHIYFYVELCLQ